ncbi:MAG: DUF1616 domain-containing protein [Herpetosiphon sp.]
MAFRPTPEMISAPLNGAKQLLRINYDLMLLAGFAASLPLVLTITLPLIQIPLGLIAVLFAPGYALTAALFVRRDDIDAVARLSLSLGLSVALLPLFGLLLAALPWGIRSFPMALVLGNAIILACAVGAIRRSRIAPSTALKASTVFVGGFGWWHTLTHLKLSIYAVLLLCSLLMFGLEAMVLWPGNPLPTEFYILGPTGGVEDYPLQTIATRAVEVQVGIDQHTTGTVHYGIEVRVDQQLLRRLSPITLHDRTSWSGKVQFTLPQIGSDKRISFVLLRDDSTVPLRQLWLTMNVLPKPPEAVGGSPEIQLQDEPSAVGNAQ